MADPSQHVASRLLGHLPAIYRERPPDGSPPFLGRFLLAFQEILDDLEETVERIPTLFGPRATPSEFRDWLARWVAFSLRADLSDEQQQEFIENLVHLYRRRGTRHNLPNFLKIFTQGTPSIEEPEEPEAEHFFRVTVRLIRDTPSAVARKLETAHALIELEKPAHTSYELRVEHPSMQIGPYSQVGVTTLIGVIPD